MKQVSTCTCESCPWKVAYLREYSRSTNLLTQMEHIVRNLKTIKKYVNLNLDYVIEHKYANLHAGAHAGQKRRKAKFVYDDGEDGATRVPKQ